MTLLTMIVKMGEGLSKTCAIFSLTLLFSLPLGMIVALLRMSKSKIISGITRFFDRVRHQLCGVFCGDLSRWYRVYASWAV